MDGSGVGIGEAIGFGMATLGVASGGRSSWGRRIGLVIELCHGIVVRCGFVCSGSLILAHLWMAWWIAFIAKSRLSHAMLGALCKAHVSVFTPWKMRSMGVTVGWVR